MSAPPPAIRFLRFEGRQVAFSVSGEGPPLVVPAWWVSHLELDWDDAAFRAFWETVGEGHTLVRYDNVGVGMSDRDGPPLELTLEAEVALLGALLDELGIERATLLGGSSGGCAAVGFAAAAPERVERLLLYGAYADGGAIAPPEVRDAIVAAVRSHWGLGARVLADVFLADASGEERERFTRLQRAAASADTAAALLQLVYRFDVRAQLAQVRAPTLVVHRREDRAIPYEQGRALAAAIPGATLVPLAGRAHLPWVGDAQSVARALRSFLLPGSASAAVARAGGEPAALLLSRREREVLALVAEGLSEREIAEQLTLSQHTVHRHVANIRHKLGRSSRAAAVAEAARLGLI
ncbi:alpha/beta fold hydrolase [Conexibacter sp. JD483]|uniref:alpha/beta fold hydrolase n=1 Tax=unclassified Conexibacter TaxID=2627773 RepID=UPI00271DBAC7|nr:MULTISPECIES: alpha/beta fold hydrolase [unclassified Conexibacter]MDO8189243.1 alpha/beta fold hydrolase [Conexibacter sp. CPCC 205706]MDO8198729.1 alpha/beta fold hydrolase [Conexibacter sp. CPCC 205762]MDR9372116.1 alpha/beta fold hydrolase [Conexibacter sp. JD483]